MIPKECLISPINPMNLLDAYLEGIYFDWNHMVRDNT